MAGLYRRMVDENLIRKDLSFAEMALTAQAYAADPETTPQNVDEAVKEVFKSAGYQKRSYIRSFARLMDLIGHLLDYPHEVPRNLGLSLLKQLEDDTTLVNDIAEKLDGWENRSIQDELGVLREFVAVSPGDDEVGKPLAPKSEQGGRAGVRAPPAHHVRAVPCREPREMHRRGRATDVEAGSRPDICRAAETGTRYRPVSGCAWLTGRAG